MEKLIDFMIISDHVIQDHIDLYELSHKLYIKNYIFSTFIHRLYCAMKLGWEEEKEMDGYHINDKFTMNRKFVISRYTHVFNGKKSRF